MRSIPLRRTAAVAATAAAVVGATSPAAFALGAVRSWNSQSAPLTVNGYGSTGWGFGTWSVSTRSDGTRSRLTASLKLRNADDHAVYAKFTTQTDAGVCLTMGYADCQFSWADYETRETGRYQGGTYATKGASTGLHNSGTWARAAVKVCLHIPWRNDPCSGTTYTAKDGY